VKPRIKGGRMIAKPWPVLDRCAENGAMRGIRRWLKHRESPELSEVEIESLAERIAQEIRDEISDAFHVEDPI
jgi:hypothetical protein